MVKKKTLRRLPLDSTATSRGNAQRKRGRPVVKIEREKTWQTQKGWHASIIFSNDDSRELLETFASRAEAEDAVQQVIEQTRHMAAFRPKRGEIQKGTDASYLKWLGIVGSLLRDPPLTETERERIANESKQMRRKSRGLRNLPKAEIGKLHKGDNTRKRAKELDAELKAQGMPKKKRQVVIARRLGMKSDTIHRLLK